MEGNISSLITKAGNVVEDGALQKYVRTFHAEIGTIAVPPKPSKKPRTSKRKGKVSNSRRPAPVAIDDLDLPRESKKICCIPACKFEGGPKTVRGKRALLKLPLHDKPLLELWLKAIPRRRGGWVNSTARVCSGHFDASCINSDTVKKQLRNGDIIEKARKRIELKPGAVPSIFPTNPFPLVNLANQSIKQKRDKDIRRLQQKLRLAQALDEILTFADLKRMADERSGSLDAAWIVKVHKVEGQPVAEAVHFLQLDRPGLAVRAALVIPHNLAPSLIFEGKTMSVEGVRNILLQDKVASWPDVLLLIKWLEKEESYCSVTASPAASATSRSRSRSSVASDSSAD